MAIGYGRFDFVGRKGGKGSAVGAAAYRHRASMWDDVLGKPFSFTHKRQDLKHSEVSLPPDAPEWIKRLVEGQSPARASEAIWNAAQDTECLQRKDARIAREFLLALPVELTLEENIALVREFVQMHLTSKGIVADWVIHGSKDNPHVHLMHTIRPLTPGGFGPKTTPVLGEDGQPLRIITKARPNGQIVYRQFVGERSVDRGWKQGWAESLNRHLALAGHDIQIDMRSYAERGLTLKPQRHLGASMAAMVREGKATHFRPDIEGERLDMADRLANDPAPLLAQLSDQQSTFTEQDIARAIHRHVDDNAVFQNVRAAVLASPELCVLRPAVPADKASGTKGQSAIYTTREIMRVEHEMAQAADRLASVRRFAVNEKTVAKAIRSVETKDPSRPFAFDAEQVEAVHHVTSAEGIAAVVGYAGAGKSTLLEAANVAWTAEGRRVFGAALAGKAAEGLEESSGIASRTLASWELAWKNGNAPLQKGDVFVIDEAGMVSSRQLARFVSAVEEAGAKLVLVGDAQQLQPIQAGAAFRAIMDRIGAKHLIGVRRQREKWMQVASRDFASGDVAQFNRGLAAYRDNGAIRITQTQDIARAALVEEWTKKRDDVRAAKAAKGEALRGDELIVLAHTNENVQNLNARMRKVLQDAGELSEARQFTTEKGTREFAVGDRLLFLDNATFIEPTAPDLERQSVKNGMLGTVTATTDSAGRPRLTVRLDAGREVVFTTDTYRSFDHGYATTIHKSQGATVDHSFVLASSMMDQHLSYVAMSRHRHSVTMFAAQDEFSSPRAGRLVEHGRAPYEHDPANKLNYYVTLENEKGQRRTIWSMDLERVMAEKKPALGERIELQHLGNVPVTLPDGTETHRNEWTMRDASDITYEMMEQRLSRSGAKTTTLDFENEPLYREHADAFLQRRGFEILRDLGPAITAVVERQASYIAEKREALADLWSRAEHALHRIGIGRQQAAEVVTPQPSPVPAQKSEERIGPVRPALIAEVRDHAEPVMAAARQRFVNSAVARAQDDELAHRLHRVYRNPKAAKEAITDAALRISGDTARLSEQILQRPESFGELRGSARLIDGRAARSAREDAMLVLPEVATAARVHAINWRNAQERHLAAENRQREAMAVEIPALSQTAASKLETLRSLREQGGADAWRKGFELVRQDAGTMSEIRAVNEALNARYGYAAFTPKADELVTKLVEERTPASARVALEAAASSLAEVRAVSSAEHFANKRDLAKAKAASATVATSAPVQAPVQTAPVSAPTPAPAEKPVPLFAAVTSFADSIEQVADRRAWAHAATVKSLDKLHAHARTVWTDPDRAVALIRSRVDAGTERMALHDEVSKNPEAFGALRGSARLLDRFSAAGAERKQAMEAVGWAAIEAAGLQDSVARNKIQEATEETENRRRMAIEVPGLSQKASRALDEIKHTRDNHAQKQMVAALSLEVQSEIAQVDKALKERFGMYRFATTESMSRRVPIDQQDRIGTIHSKMMAVETTRSVQSVIEQDRKRMARGVSRGVGPKL